MRFEDKKDAEEVFLQAQMDLKINVLNDTTATVGHDETLTVQNARTRTVKEGDETVTLEKGKRSVTIQTGSDTLDVKDSRTVTVGADQTHSTGGNYEHKVTGDYSLTVDGNLTIKVMFAAGMPPVSVRFTGSTLSTAGAAPKLHCRVAVAQTCGQPMSNLLPGSSTPLNHSPPSLFAHIRNADYPATR